MKKERHILRHNWKSIRENIEQVIKEQQLAPEDFKPVNINEWEAIENKIIATFCDFPLSYKYRPTWLWEYFKFDGTTLSNLVEYAPQYLPELLGQEECVWFFVNDHKSKFWYYEGKVRSIQTIIDESHWDEFYIVSKKYDWLICMNHHEILTAIGAEIPEKLREIKERVDPILKRANN